MYTLRFFLLNIIFCISFIIIIFFLKEDNIVIRIVIPITLIYSFFYSIVNTIIVLLLHFFDINALILKSLKQSLLFSILPIFVANFYEHIVLPFITDTKFSIAGITNYERPWYRSDVFITILAFGLPIIIAVVQTKYSKINSR